MEVPTGSASSHELGTSATVHQVQNFEAGCWQAAPVVMSPVLDQAASEATFKVASENLQPEARHWRHEPASYLT
jgi:hypothetical protein